MGQIRLRDGISGCLLFGDEIFSSTFDDRGKPFYLRWSAGRYPVGCSNNFAVTVRVNPKNQEEMQFFDFDEKD
jgi:hypothetical protein